MATATAAAAATDTDTAAAAATATAKSTTAAAATSTATAQDQCNHTAQCPLRGICYGQLRGQQYGNLWPALPGVRRVGGHSLVFIIYI